MAMELLLEGVRWVVWMRNGRRREGQSRHWWEGLVLLWQGRESKVVVAAGEG